MTNTSDLGQFKPIILELICIASCLSWFVKTGEPFPLVVAAVLAHHAWQVVKKEKKS